MPAAYFLGGIAAGFISVIKETHILLICMETVALTDLPVEKHPLEPFLPKNARLLMLGSFPPQKKRWSMEFFYPNFTNDMWRIFGHIFFNDRNYFIVDGKKQFDRDRLVAFLKEKGVALYDTAVEVRRLKDNASDKFLEVVRPTDIEELVRQLPECRAIVTTGQKATDTICVATGAAEPAVGGYTEFEMCGRRMRLYRMPSSSRAYPMSVEKKAGFYSVMFSEIFI